MFGEMPIECDYDVPNCLSGGGGYILGPGDVFNPPNNKRYGFDVPPNIQPLPMTGYFPISENSGSNSPLSPVISNGPQSMNAIVNPLLTPNVQAIASGHPFLVLGILASIIYLVTK